MPEPPRRFPPPWRVEKMPSGYVVRAKGWALAEALQASRQAGDYRRVDPAC
jgi:hypothetical protein